MKEYRPLNPPEETEADVYIKCDHCGDSFKDGQIPTLPWGHYCKRCCDNYVENNIREGDNEYQVNKEMKEFKEQYLLTFNTEYK